MVDYQKKSEALEHLTAETEREVIPKEEVLTSKM